MVAGIAALVTGLGTLKPRGSVAGIPDHQRHLNQFAVQRLAVSPQVMLPERFTVVRRNHDQRIVSQSAPPQFVHQVPDVVIDILHAVVVCIDVSLSGP